MSGRVAVYVDGFNLYHGLHAATGRKDLWLDLESLFGSSSFLAVGERLVVVHYFTARVRGEDAAGRQEVYLRALRAHGQHTEVHIGRFQERVISCRRCGAKPMRCRSCQTPGRTFEEKETDVSLAVQLVGDAALDRYDKALLVTADSDMMPGISMVRTIAPGKPIQVIFPPERSSAHLRSLADATLYLRKNQPRRHQLPPRILVPGTARTLTRPAHWS